MLNNYETCFRKIPSTNDVAENRLDLQGGPRSIANSR
jgi:hypothetical protein